MFNKFNLIVFVSLVFSYLITGPIFNDKNVSNKTSNKNSNVLTKLSVAKIDRSSMFSKKYVLFLSPSSYKAVNFLNLISSKYNNFSMDIVLNDLSDIHYNNDKYLIEQLIKGDPSFLIQNLKKLNNGSYAINNSHIVSLEIEDYINSVTSIENVLKKHFYAKIKENEDLFIYDIEKNRILSPKEFIKELIDLQSSDILNIFNLIKR